VAVVAALLGLILLEAALVVWTGMLQLASPQACSGEASAACFGSANSGLYTSLLTCAQICMLMLSVKRCAYHGLCTGQV
jgi:hypothetical protein